MRHLPVIYGGHDAGPRPDTRHNVHAALARGVDPVVVAEHVARGVSDLWDTCLTELPEAEPKPACARGCSACCHQRVEVTAPEVFRLVRWLVANHGGELSKLERDVTQAAERLTAYSSREPFVARVGCVFLDAEGGCSVYPARPLACRRAHSLDAELCHTLLAAPQRSVVVPTSDVISWNLSALILGYYEGMAHAGIPPRHYELTHAVALALGSPGSEEQWRRGLDPLEAAMTRTADELSELLGGRDVLNELERT